MSNISFTNPYLLLVGLVFIALVCIPFFLSIKKSGFNFHNITSLVCHILIAIMATLALAQMTLRTVQTKTTVYVLADVSYSSHNNLDKIDEQINSLKKNLPKNSEIGIICYGKDFEVLVEPGQALKSVKEAKVDDSATSIKPALEYASGAFSDNVIKRIVIISDGNETNDDHISGLISDYESRDIHIDAIYLDNNLPEDAGEVQISNTTLSDTTVINSNSDVTFTIDSNKQTSCDLELYEINENEEEILVTKTTDILLSKGSNSMILNMDTSVSGTHYYHAKLVNIKDGDLNDINNSYFFNQTITEALNVLFIGTNQADYDNYVSKNDNVNVTSYINNPNVPYNLEDLCQYDEFVLSNINISDLSYSELFVTNLEKAISLYGKSLVTIGNTYIQNNKDGENSTLSILSQMLPLKYDNSSDKSRLYTIILDISKSMDSISHLKMAKQAAYSIIDLLEETDSLYVIAFYGDVITPFNVDKATPSNKLKAKEVISKLDSKQATSLGAALNYAYESLVTKNYISKQIMLISDGLSYGLDQTNIDNAAKKLGNANIHVSTIFTAKTDEDVSINLKNIASYGNGNYYSVSTEEQASNLVLTAVADEVTESYKTSKDGFELYIKKPKDELVADLNKLSSVNDFYVSVAKTTAQTIVEVEEKSKKYPLYSNWSYGEGKVSCITTSFSNVDEELVKRIPTINKPNLYGYTPFLFESSLNGSSVEVVVTPPEINSLAVATLKVTYPSKSNIGVQEIVMSFNSKDYLTSFNCEYAGTYNLELSYKVGSIETKAQASFVISYMPEYDSFELFDASNLYRFITSDGQVVEEGKLQISNDGLPVTYYKYEFAPLLMILCCVVFVCDIAIRKLRWQDIKDIFTKKKRVKDK